LFIVGTGAKLVFFPNPSLAALLARWHGHKSRSNQPHQHMPSPCAASSAP
jgi:hypothetical protein